MRPSMERVRRSPEPVIRMVAQARNHEQVVADLHARVVAVTGAVRSILLEVDADRRRLRPTSGSGGEPIAPEPWIELPDSLALAYEVLASGHPRQIAPLMTVLPDLALRLGTPAAIIAPLVSQGRALGLLVLAMPGVVPALGWMDQVAGCADALALALTRARVEHELAIRQGIDTALHDLAEAVGRGGRESAIENCCSGLARLLKAERVSLWQHDREARRLAVVAASDGSHHRRPASAPTADTDALLVKAMRGTRVELMDVATTPRSAVNAAVPLRGQRRALGVLVLQGLAVPPGDLSRLRGWLGALGSQMSRVLEGRQLLDDVLQARRTLDHAFDASRDIVLTLDARRRLVRVNDAALARSGRLRSDVVGGPVTALVGGAFSEWIAGLPDDAAPGAAPPTSELVDEALGGAFVATAMPLPSDGTSPAGWLVVARNVTEERRLASEQTALRERLGQSEALSQLVAGIAHELSNPLQGVLGHIELLRKTTRVPAAVADPLKRIHRDADRAARIVRNLLLLAGAGRLALRATSVNVALTRAVGLRAAACRQARITVRRQLGTGLPRVLGDALLLQQAFLNILINAEQALAGRPGGRIEIRTARKNRAVVVEIRDNGPGLDEDIAPRVFEAFFTTREAGSGLGLALTRRIVREHGGDVTACNTPGGGACFTMSLPVRPVVK